MFLSGVSRGELLQLYLVISVTGLVEPNEQSSVRSLDALKKSLKKKETRTKKEIVDVLQQASYGRKRLG